MGFVPTDDFDGPVRILVVDDDFLVRAAVQQILGAQTGIEVVGVAADGVEAVQLARTTRPDVVLMDIQMPGMDGVTATKAVLSAVDTNVVAMTSLALSDVVERMLAAGAYGYVLKDTAPEALAEAVFTVARGDAYLSPRHTRALLERLASEVRSEDRRQTVSLFGSLTAREKAVARLVASGATDGEIAAAMHLALSTVKAHIQQVRIRFGARNRTQIGVMVERAGETPALTNELAADGASGVG